MKNSGYKYQDITPDIEYKRPLSEIHTYVFAWCSQAYAGIEVSLAWFSRDIECQIPECRVQFDAIFRIKCNALGEINATSHNITSRESGTVVFAGTLTTERMPVITVISP